MAAPLTGISSMATRQILAELSEAYTKRTGQAVAIESVGGRILWQSEVEQVVIGDDGDGDDEVIAVWYPSRSAFLQLMAFPGYLEAAERRKATLEHATLLALTPPPGT